MADSDRRADIVRRKAAQRRRRVTALTRLWARHDRLERQILLMERHFSDAELRRLGAAAGSDR